MSILFFKIKHLCAIFNSTLIMVMNVMYMCVYTYIFMHTICFLIYYSNIFFFFYNHFWEGVAAWSFIHTEMLKFHEMQLNPHQLYQLHLYLQAVSRQCGLCVQRSLLLHDKRPGVRVCVHMNLALVCTVACCVGGCVFVCSHAPVHVCDLLSSPPSEPLSHTHTH